MKRYVLFTGDNYYPSGGFYDFNGAYEILEDAKSAGLEFFEKSYSGWWHVLDLELGVVVARHNA